MISPIPALSQYTQLVTVMPVNPNDPGANENQAAPTLPKGAYTGALRVRVRIYFQQTPASVKSLVFTVVGPRKQLTRASELLSLPETRNRRRGCHHVG